MIRRLADDEDLRKDLVEKGKKRAREFQWKAAAERLVEFYRRAIDEEKGAKLR